MTTLSKKFRCEQLAGHADWAAHIIGYLHADPNADVRRGLLEALLSARQTYWLPGYVETAIRDLMSEQGAEDAPF